MTRNEEMQICEPLQILDEHSQIDALKCAKRARKKRKEAQEDGSWSGGAETEGIPGAEREERDANEENNPGMKQIQTHAKCFRTAREMQNPKAAAACEKMHEEGGEVTLTTPQAPVLCAAA